NAQRLQNKAEAPPEQNKVGACGDYFVPEGVNPAIHAELPAGQQFPAGADPRGVLRKFPEQNGVLAVTDGTSNTILAGECAGREDVWRGRRMTPPRPQTRSGRTAPAPAAAPGPRTTTPMRSAHGWSDARAARSGGR